MAAEQPGLVDETLWYRLVVETSIEILNLRPTMSYRLPGSD
jgi:hypothetical protein